MKSSLQLWALALTTALNATPVIAQQSTTSMTKEQIHSRVIELCNMPNIQKGISKQDKEICDEYSTDGGKTWIKAVGWASILAAIGIGALVRIRKRETEKQWEIKEEDSKFPQEDATPFHEEVHWGNEEDDLDDWDIVWVDADIKVDNLSEAEVYAAYWRYGQAAELFQEEVRKNPENTNAYLKLAGVYKQMKEASKAVIDKNPTIKDSGLLKELSNFERSLSESELKKLIETAETGSIPKNDGLTQTNDIEWEKGIIPTLQSNETIASIPAEEVIITHEEINPHLITPSENIIPTQTIEEKAPIHAKFTPKNQWKLWIDKAVITRLDSLGFGIEKSEDGNSATITVLKEWVSLRYIEVGTSEPQSINKGESYTITNATGIFYTNRSGDPTLMVRQRSGKDRYIQIIVEKKEVPPSK